MWLMQNIKHVCIIRP